MTPVEIIFSVAGAILILAFAFVVVIRAWRGENIWRF